MPNSSHHINAHYNVYYQNTRGLNTKTNEFYVNCCLCSHDIIILTETWLSNSINNAELFTDFYNITRADRKFEKTERTRGGGVLIALRKEISYTTVDCSILNDIIPLIDIVICNCIIENTHLYICAIYIPPDIPIEDIDTFFTYLEQLLLDKPAINGRFQYTKFC